MKTAPIVPYLKDDSAQFRMDFVFFDHALSTSEIRPLHLTLPGNKTLSKKGTVKPGTGQGAANKQQTPQKGRLLDKAALSQKILEPEKNDKENQNQENSEEKPAQNTAISSTLKSYMATASKTKKGMGTKIRNSSSNSLMQGAEGQPKPHPTAKPTPSRPAQAEHQPEKQSTPPPQQKQEEKHQEAPKQPLSKEPSKDLLGLDFELNGAYLLPCLPNQYINMQFKIEKTDLKTIFKLIMPSNIDSEQRLRVELDGKSRQGELHIIYNGKDVGEFTYNASNKVFSVGLMNFQPPLEACAVLYNPSFAQSNFPRIFDLIIPALKKVNGRNQMYKIQYSEQSQLIQCVSRMAKESIRLKCRIPSNKGNEFDMTFAGKFNVNSPMNFILYHDSSPKRDICTFQAVDNSTYNVVVGYPLSPIQAFFAGVASCIPV